MACTLLIYFYNTYRCITHKCNNHKCNTHHKFNFYISMNSLLPSFLKILETIWNRVSGKMYQVMSDKNHFLRSWKKSVLAGKLLCS